MFCQSCQIYHPSDASLAFVSSSFPSSDELYMKETLLEVNVYSPSVHFVALPFSCTVTASCPVYELNAVAELEVGGAGGCPAPGLLDAPAIPAALPLLGILYSASAKSAARFNIISFGNFSGSPGCRGINFCNL